MMSTLALFRVAIFGRATEEPSVCTPVVSIFSISSRKSLTGIFSSVSWPPMSMPTKDTYCTSG